MAFVSNNRTLISSLSFFKFLNLFCSQQQGRQQRVELERHSSGHGTAIRQQLPDSARREWSTFHRAHLMRYISIFHELLKPRRRAARGKVPEGIIKNGQDVLQKYRMAYTAFGSFFLSSLRGSDSCSSLVTGSKFTAKTGSTENCYTKI